MERSFNTQTLPTGLESANDSIADAGNPLKEAQRLFSLFQGFYAHRSLIFTQGSSNCG